MGYTEAMKDILKAAKKLLKIESDFQAQLEKLGYNNHSAAIAAMAALNSKVHLEMLVKILEEEVKNGPS